MQYTQIEDWCFDLPLVRDLAQQIGPILDLNIPLQLLLSTLVQNLPSTQKWLSLLVTTILILNTVILKTKHMICLEVIQSLAIVNIQVRQTKENHAVAQEIMNGELYQQCGWTET